MKILLTGSRGYIGSALRPALEASGHQVKEFDKIIGNDITNPEEIKQAAKTVDLIVHLAALVGLKEQDSDILWQVNVRGTSNVLLCKKPVIFSSVLGHFDVRIVYESSVMSPINFYYRAKQEAEELVLSKKGTVLRLGTLYGVSSPMRDDLMIHNFCRQAVTEGKISLFEPELVRAITNLQDVVAAFILLIASGRAGLWHVVSTNETKGHIASLISELTGCTVEFTNGEDSEKRNYFAVCNKIISLGFSPKPNLVESIEAIVEHYRGIDD